MAQTYKFGRGTWATKEGSTLAYNDENENYKPLPFNFERDSIATRVNKEGLIEVVGNDIPRIDYTDSADGVLLLENSATNLVTHSEDFSNAAWVKLGAGTGSTAIVTSDYAISPDGTQNASRLQCDLNGGNTVSDQSLIYDSYNASGSQTISIYAKSNNNQNQTLYFSNTVTYDETDNIVVTNEWKRFEFTHSTTTDVLAIGLRGGTQSDDNVDILIWGGQAEVGNLSSYIPTQGSAQTRVAETASGSGNSEVFNDSEGVLFADISALDNDLTNRRITISDPSGQNFVMINYTTTTNQIAYSYYVSGVYEVYLTENISKITNNTKISVSWSLNKFQMYINGFLVKEQLSGNLMTGNNLDNLRFSLWNGNNPFYGKTKELGYYDTALTDEELEYMTSYRSLNELVTELNLNTL